MNNAHVVSPAAPAPEAAYGMSTGALVMAFFGYVWFGWGFSEAPFFTVPDWILLMLAAIALVGVAVAAMRRARFAMGTRGADSRKRFWALAGKRFGAITAFEGLGCGLVVGLTLAFHRSDLLAIGISIVVGLHFLPMSPLFRFPAYLAVGAGIVVADIALWATLPPETLTFAAGVCTGAILWAAAVYSLVCARYARARLAG